MQCEWEFARRRSKVAINGLSRCVCVLQLLSNLESTMFCHKVKVESPLELEPKGTKDLQLY